MCQMIESPMKFVALIGSFEWHPHDCSIIDKNMHSLLRFQDFGRELTNTSDTEIQIVLRIVVISNTLLKARFFARSLISAALGQIQHYLV